MTRTPLSANVFKLLVSILVLINLTETSVAHVLTEFRESWVSSYISDCNKR